MPLDLETQGRILASLDYLKEGQARLEALMLQHFTAFATRQQQHESHDDTRFETLTRALTNLRVQTAMVCATMATIWAVVKFLF